MLDFSDLISEMLNDQYLIVDAGGVDMVIIAEFIEQLKSYGQSGFEVPQFFISYLRSGHCGRITYHNTLTGRLQCGAESKEWYIEHESRYRFINLNDFIKEVPVEDDPDFEANLSALLAIGD